MDVNYTVKEPTRQQGAKNRRQWLNTPENSKLVFRRELLESADSIALKTERSVAPIREQDGVLFESGKSFSELGIHEQICEILKSKFQIRNPTFIQQQAIPRILKGEDIIIKAQTGSGKTLAFLLPILTKLFTDYQQRGPSSFKRDEWASKVLIVSPTKELAMQSEMVAASLLSRTVMVSGSLTGAISRDKEKASLRKGITVISGTPGRIQDHLNQTACFKLTHIQAIVLDECDQLISHGFSSALQTILSHAREANPKVQVVLASATADRRVLDFIRSSVREAIPVGDLFSTNQAAIQPEAGLTKAVTPVSLDQRFCIVPSKMRLALLISTLAFETAKAAESRTNIRVLVFAETKDVCTLLNEILMRLSEAEMSEDHFILAKVFHLHGSLSVEDRQIVWHRFLESGGVLVATDVAARGLNLGSGTASSGLFGVDLVIQFEAPSSCEQYVHRVGRAGRMGQRGRSILFLLESEADLVPLLGSYGIGLTATPVDALAERVLEYRKPIRLMERVQTKVEELIANDKELRRMAVQAFSMYIRGYSMKSSDVRHVFNLKSLHLGHIAKGFGLSEAPSKVLEEFRPSKRQIKQARMERLAQVHGVKMKDKRSHRLKTKFDVSERDNRPVFKG